jgi:hypothetical protein
VVKLSVRQDGGHPRTGIPEILETRAIIIEIPMPCITNKYSEAAYVIQQVCKVLSDIEIFAKCTRAKVGESSEWTTIVNNAEENKANFCKILKGKPLFSAPYGIYTLTLNELMAILKVNAQAGQSRAVTTTSLE